MQTNDGVIFIGSESHPLSSAYPAPVKHQGRTFHSAWHYVLYQKAVLFRDIVAAHKIATAPDVQSLSGLEDSITGVHQGNWLRNCAKFMDEANLAKFEQHAALRDVLLNTASQAVLSTIKPGSIWCVAPPEAGVDVTSDANWDGLNIEGRSLMKTRKILMASLIPRRSWRWDATPEPVSLQRKIDICFSWRLGFCQVRPRQNWLADLQNTPAETLAAALCEYGLEGKWDSAASAPQVKEFLAWLAEGEDQSTFEPVAATRREEVVCS